MDKAPSTPYRSLLRQPIAEGEVPDELLPSNEALRLLCRTCARTLPRGDMVTECKPPFTRILIATDGSALADDAATLGVSLAQALVASVVFLHAATPWRGGRVLARLFAAAEVAVDPDCASLAERNLERQRSLAMNAGVRCETRLAYDPHPDRAILQAVVDIGCDLIVMGARGGRLARRVARRTGVPLLTCRSAAPGESAAAS
ncbi:MAG: universal stress protein [Luteibacter jiangsuensis]